MKKFTKLFLMVICASMLLQPLHVMAMNKDVTKTIAASEKKKIRKLTDNFKTVCLGYDYEFHVNGKKKVSLNFRKNSDRKAALNYIAMYYYRKSVKTLSSHCFGTTTKMKRGSGDAGAIPSVKIRKILQTGKKQYVVKGNAYAEDPGGEAGKEKMGSFSLTIAKKSGSYYGYVATKMVFKRAE